MTGDVPGDAGIEAADESEPLGEDRHPISHYWRAVDLFIVVPIFAFFVAAIIFLSNLEQPPPPIVGIPLTIGAQVGIYLLPIAIAVWRGYRWRWPRRRLHS